MRFFRYFAYGLLVCLAVGLCGGYWYIYLAQPVPGPRPELVRLPEGAPPPPPGYATERAMMLGYALGHVQLIDKNPPVPENVEERLDVEYGQVDGTSLLLNLYRPRVLDKAVPGLIFIHGGGWRSGDRGDYKVYTTHFASEGYVAVSISYRLSKVAPFPAAVEDAKCAVRWMRENAQELGVDAERICVIGGSAGGHLSMMVGYTADEPALEGRGGHAGVSSRVAAVVDLYGPSSLMTETARVHDMVTSFLGVPYEAAPKSYAIASPITHLDAGDPPTFVLQGTIDTLVTPDQSDMLAEKLEALGVPYWYARLEGWPHTMDEAQPVNDWTKELLGSFFETFLGAKP